MATFVLIPGAASDGWYWHLVEPELRAAGHRTVAVDLPCDDDRAGFAEYADVVLDAIAAARAADDVVLVAQSMAGFTAPIVATRTPVSMIVMVNAMTPAPGESAGAWWANTGQAQARREALEALGLPEGPFDEQVVFLHDVPPDVVERSAGHVREQSSTPFETPWPLAAWPADVPTRFLVCRDDRLFPPAFQRRVVAERLGITPDEMDGGHLPALARPRELAARLLRYVAER